MELMDNEQLQELVGRLSRAYFNRPFIDEARFNYRLQTTGGRYIPSQRVIELNPKFLVELGEEEFHGIIKHELCHYHLHIEGKGYKHRDMDFKQLLRETGSPRHCNILPSAERKKKMIYVCSGCGNVYKRMRAINTRRYVCGKCKGKLVKQKTYLNKN